MYFIINACGFVDYFTSIKSHVKNSYKWPYWFIGMIWFTYEVLKHMVCSLIRLCDRIGQWSESCSQSQTSASTWRRKPRLASTTRPSVTNRAQRSQTSSRRSRICSPRWGGRKNSGVSQLSHCNYCNERCLHPILDKECFLRYFLYLNMKQLIFFVHIKLGLYF